MDNKGLKSAVAAVAIATMVCGCGNNGQTVIDDKNNVDMSTNIIEVENMTQEEYIDFTESLKTIDYSYEKLMLNGEKPVKMTDSSNFKFEYNQDGYMVKQTVVNNIGKEQLEFIYKYTTDESNNTVLTSREDRVVKTDEVLRFVDYSEGKESYYNNSNKEIEYVLAEFNFFEDWSLYSYSAVDANTNGYLQIDFQAGTKTESEYDVETMMPIKTIETDNDGNVTDTTIIYNDNLVKEVLQKVNGKIYKKTIYEYSESGIESGYKTIVYD